MLLDTLQENRFSGVFGAFVNQSYVKKDIECI